MKRSVILTDRFNRARYFISVLDERTSFASRARAFESTRLLNCFEWLLTRNQRWLRKNCTTFRIILQYSKVVMDDGFYWVIVRVKCEGEWNSVIFFLFVTFVVLTVNRFVECGDGPFELQKQDSHIFRKTGTFL